MNKILNRYTKIKHICNLPLQQRWQHIIQLPRKMKESFVHDANVVSVKTYEGYFKGKKIAIIGPSPSITNTENGEDIEKHYDIIVRINKAWKHNAELNKYIGRRTDVLYNCIDHHEECGGVIDIEYAKKAGLKLIVDPIKFAYYKKDERDRIFHNNYRLNRYIFFHLNNMGRIPFGVVRSVKYSAWDAAADTRINTGLLAIIDILHLDVKEVYVKGFTFFKDGYIPQYRNSINFYSMAHANTTANHDQKKQWLFFKNLLRNEHIRNKLNMDKALETIMEQETFV